MCAGQMSMLGAARADVANEKEINDQSTALTHCILRVLSFGGSMVRTICCSIETELILCLVLTQRGTEMLPLLKAA